MSQGTGGRERQDARRSGPGQPGGRGTRGTPLSGAEFAGVGLQFAATIVVFMFGGIWLDRTLGTSPWLLLVCVFVGAGAGFYSIYRKVIDAQRRSGEGRGTGGARGTGDGGGRG